MSQKPRSQRLLEYLVAHPRGLQIHQLRDGAAPEASVSVVSAQMGQLVEAGKARRTGAARSTTYFPTANSLVDRRRVAEPKPKPRKAAPAPAPQPVKAAARATLREPVAPPPAPATSPLRQPITRSATGRSHALDSDQIAADVADFLRRGGRIQYLRPGESSETQREAEEAFLASRRRNRSKQQPERAKATQADALFDDDDADDELAAA